MKKMKKKKNLNKSFLCILTVFVLLFVLAIPCFAWTRLPFEAANNEYCFAFKENTTERQNFCIYAYSHNGTYWYVSIDGLTFSYLTPDMLDDLIYVPIKTTSPTEAQARQIIQNEIAKFNSSIQGDYLNTLIDNTYSDGQNEGYSSGYDEGYNQGVSSSDGYGVGFVAGQAQQYETDLRDIQVAFGTVPGSTWENVDNNISQSVSTSLSSSKDSWLSEGKQGAYNAGYNDGLAEADVAETTILTIFSVPSYVLSTIFNFEIFGINLYALITFLLTITIVGTVIKKII